MIDWIKVPARGFVRVATLGAAPAMDQSGQSIKDPFKKGYNLEKAIAACASLFALTWVTTRDRSTLAQICNLAALVCAAKFMRFVAIGLDHLHKKRRTVS